MLVEQGSHQVAQFGLAEGLHQFPHPSERDRGGAHDSFRTDSGFDAPDGRFVAGRGDGDGDRGALASGGASRVAPRRSARPVGRRQAQQRIDRRCVCGCRAHPRREARRRRDADADRRGRCRPRSRSGGRSGRLLQSSGRDRGRHLGRGRRWTGSRRGPAGGRSVGRLRCSRQLAGRGGCRCRPTWRPRRCGSFGAGRRGEEIGNGEWQNVLRSAHRHFHEDELVTVDDRITNPANPTGYAVRELIGWRQPDPDDLPSTQVGPQHIHVRRRGTGRPAWRHGSPRGCRRWRDTGRGRWVQGHECWGTSGGTWEVLACIPADPASPDRHSPDPRCCAALAWSAELSSSSVRRGGKRCSNAIHGVGVVRRRDEPGLVRRRR